MTHKFFIPYQFVNCVGKSCIVINNDVAIDGKILTTYIYNDQLMIVVELSKTLECYFWNTNNLACSLTQMVCDSSCVELL